MREGRYGGKEGDESPSSTSVTNRHYTDNATVEDSVSVEYVLSRGGSWWKADIVSVLRYIIKLCESQLKQHEGPITAVERASYWLPFQQFCELCTSTRDIGQTVNYMGRLLDDFPHAYGEDAPRTRFLHHILPRATEAARLAGIKIG